MADLGNHLFGRSTLSRSMGEPESEPAATSKAARKLYQFGDDDDVSSFASDDSFVDEFFHRLDHRPGTHHDDVAAKSVRRSIGDAANEGLRVDGAYVRGKSGVAVRGEVDIVESTDFASKVQALYESLTKEMLDEVATHRKIRERRNDPLSDFDRDCIQRGVDPETLRDLKAAFSMILDGIEGVQETLFMKAFGSRLCANLTTEEIRLWFRSIDANCSGSVSWPEIAEYLSEYRDDGQVNKSYFVDFTIEAPALPGGRRAHKQIVPRMLYNTSLDLIYTFAGDGVVRAWEPSALRPHPTAVHSLGTAVADVSLAEHNNRLLVLQKDRTVFVYDTYLDVTRQPRHDLYRGFATQGKSARTLHDGTSFYEAHSKRSEKARGVSGPHMVPVSLLAQGNHNFSCIDDLGGSTHGEPVAIGTEGGTAELYSLVLGAQRPLVPTKVLEPHSEWITWLKHTPEMLGILTSSLDGTLAVTDLETGIRLQHMVAPHRGRKPKPVYHATYHRFNNTLVSCVGRSLHVWNALTGAHLTTLPDHDALVTGLAINADRQHVYALQENKTIRVWDLRTWRCIGTAEDTIKRTPQDEVGSIMWCDSSNLLVCASSSLFGWRPSDVQEKLDAGLRPSDTETRVHLTSILSAHVIPEASHIFSVDTNRGFVWGADGKHLMRLWKWPREQDTMACVTMDLAGLRSIVGTEAGEVWWVNYANGYLIKQLHHGLPRGPVTSAVVTKGIVESASNIAFVTVGRTILGWCSDSTSLADVKEPNFTYTLPDHIHGHFEGVLELHAERQLMAGVTNLGETVLLTLSLVGIATFPLPCEGRKVNVDALGVLLPGVLAYGCSDGMIRVQGFFSSQSHRSVVLTEFRGAFGDEGITAIRRYNRRLIVGDGLGVISVFECPKLLDDRFIAKDVLPHIGETSIDKARAAIDHFVELKTAFRAHDSALVTLEVNDAGPELVTGGTDRHLRSWKIDRDFAFTADIGRQNSDGIDFATSASDIRRSATGKLMLPPVGTKLTELHPFNNIEGTASTSTAPGNSMSLVSTTELLEQMRAVQPRRRKESRKTQKAPEKAASSGQATLMPPQQRPGDSHAVPSRGSTPPQRQREALPVLRGRHVSKTPGPRKLGTMTSTECFVRATDRLMHQKPVQRDVPHTSVVDEQLSEVNWLREKRGNQVREETKRAFSLLSLPPMAKRSVLNAPGSPSQKLLQRDGTLPPL